MLENINQNNIRQFSQYAPSYYQGKQAPLESRFGYSGLPPTAPTQNKEKFFESLGLPPNLEKNAVENFQYSQSAQRPPNNQNLSSIMVSNNTFDSHLLSSGGRSDFKSNFAQKQIENTDLIHDLKAEQPYQTASFSQGFGSSPKEVLTITIEIGNGQNENIIIHEGDDPRELARQFARKHGIGEQLTDLLAEQIRMNIDQMTLTQESVQQEEQIQVNPVVYDEKMDEVMSLMSQGDSIQGVQLQNSFQMAAQQNTYLQPSHQTTYPQTSQQNTLPLNSFLTSQQNTQPQSSHQNTQPHSSKHNTAPQNTYLQPTFQQNSYQPSPHKAYQYQFRPSQNYENSRVPTMAEVSNVQQSYRNGVQVYQPHMMGSRNQNNDEVHTASFPQNLENARSDPDLGLQFQESSRMTETQSFQNYGSKQYSSTANNANNNVGFIDPTSQQYLDWYRGLSNKLQGQKHLPSANLQEKPKISDNSQKIVEQKRYGGSNDGSGFHSSGNVHHRLHQAAVTRQRAQRSIGASSHHSMQREPLRRSNSNQMMPSGQYKMMLDQKKAGSRLRSSSVQGDNSEKMCIRRSYNSTGKQSFSETKSNQGSVNYGELLYQRGMRRKEEMRKIVQRAKSEQDNQEIEGLSFKPKINKVSKQMKRVNNEKAEDFLIKYGKAVKDKLDCQRIESLRRETEGLNFKPQVSKVSAKIVEQKEMRNSSKGKYAKFDSLYQDAQRRQERQEYIYSACIESECTFQPDIEKTKFFASKQASLRSSKGQSQVFERLSHRLNNSQDRSRMLIENSKSLTNDLFDPETGQELFKPRVGRAPLHQIRAKDPGTQLYQEALKSRDRKMQKEKQIQSQQKLMASQSKSKTKSNKIVERAKMQNFVAIFQRLDSDCDGQISAYRIDISSLEPELLQVLSPLFVEMEELGMSLNQDEFIDAANRLYETVTLPEKNLLVNRNERSRSGSARGAEKKRLQELEMKKAFKPQLNPNSLRIAEQKSQSSIMHRSIQHQRQHELKIAQQKNAELTKELLGCTFKPKIHYRNTSITNQNTTNRSDSFQHTMNHPIKNYSKDTHQTITTNSIDMNLMAQKVVKDMLENKNSSSSQYLIPLQQKPPIYTQSSAEQTSEYQQKVKQFMDNALNSYRIPVSNSPENNYPRQMSSVTRTNSQILSRQSQN